MKNRLPIHSPSRFLSRYFAVRGYTLAVLFLIPAFARLRSDAPLRWEFLFFAGLGAALRFWAGLHLGAHGNAVKVQSPIFVQEGPYRFSRNPLYLSNIVVGTSLLLFANCLSIRPMAVIFLALIVHHSLLVMWEEKNLRAQWNEAYAKYVRETPRWIAWNSAAAPQGSNPLPWKKIWIWQGRNFAYALFCILLIWGAALWK